MLPQEMIHFDADEFFFKLGKWGRFQLQTIFITEGVVALVAFQFMSMVFVNITPPHTCVTRYENPDLIREPRNISWFTVNRTLQCLNPKHLDEPCGEGDSKIIYDPSYGNSIVTEWSLVCDQSIYAKMGGSFFMLGCFFGAMTVSTCSDRFGRRWTYMVTSWLFSIFSALTGAAPNYITYGICRFLTGFFSEGAGMTAWVLVSECVSSRHRSYVNMFGGFSWTFGQLMLCAAAYFLRDWRDLHAALAVPMLLTLTFYWIVPESLHWLLAKRKFDDSADMVNNVLRMNGKQSTSNNNLKLKRSPSGHNIVPVNRNILHALKSPILAINTLLLAYIWIVNVFVYYGLSLFIPQLSPARFLNFTLSTLVELPAFLFTPFFCNWFGRRPTSVGAHLLAGVSLISLIFVPPTAPIWVRSALGLLGKYGISSSFNALFLYMTELFPTTMRSSGCGFCSMVGRIGAIVMPYVALDTMNHVVPPATFGTLAIGGAVACFLLPETKDRELPRDIQHVQPGLLASMFYDAPPMDPIFNAKASDSEKVLLNSFNA